MHIKQATNGEAAKASIVLVIPCYNEEKRLAANTFLSFVRQFPDIRFLFVDDGSTDKTRQIIHMLCDRQPQNIALLSLQKNMGKAEAVRHGLLHALKRNADYLGYWDADLSTPLPEVFGMLRTAQAHPEAQMITGARVRLMGRTIERRTMRHYFGRCFATLASILLHIPVYDTQCGAKIFRATPHLTAILGSPFLTRWTFDVELFARIMQVSTDPPTHRQCLVVEYPLKHWHEKAGTKIRLLDVVRLPWDLLRIAVHIYRKKSIGGRRQT